MKTTQLNNNTENMLKAIKGVNGSLITIGSSVIEQAIKEKLLHKVAEHTSHKGNQNIYFQVTDSNDILMHVQNDMYVLISRYVYCTYTDRMVDVIPYLLHFSFYAGRTGSNRCHVMASCPENIQRAGGFSKSVYLTRLLISIERFGALMNLRTADDIHHKGDCYDNRQLMIMMVPSSKHTHRNSHMTGKLISSYQQFKSFIQFMDDKFKEVSQVTEVA